MEKGSRSTPPQPSCCHSSAHEALQSSTPPSRLSAVEFTSTTSGTDWQWSPQPAGWALHTAANDYYAPTLWSSVSELALSLTRSASSSLSATTSPNSHPTSS